MNSLKVLILSAAMAAMTGGCGGGTGDNIPAIKLTASAVVSEE